MPPPAVPKFVLLASRGERLPVHGDGLATRSYLYVADVAEAFDIILHKASGGGSGLFGTATVAARGNSRATGGWIRRAAGAECEAWRWQARKDTI